MLRKNEVIVMKGFSRYTRIVRIYAVAGVLTLALWSAANASCLERWRQSAAYGSSLAFEETVRAVDALAAALDHSLYATDGAMCSRVCGEAYASACAAEAAMASLPFSTQELEHLSAFLNRVGDYAHSLCAESALSGLSGEQREALTAFSARCDEFVGTLLSLREDLNAGDVRMDTRERRLRNVGTEPGTPLSVRLLDYEASFLSPETPSYDGKFSGSAADAETGYLTEEEMRSSAAEFLGVRPEELEKAYDYEGSGGRKCFRCGDTFLCVSRGGVESLNQARLVSEAALSPEDGQAAAEAFLRKNGYEALSLTELRSNGTVLTLRYARSEGEAVWLDNTLSIAVALDDGSIYSFNAADYRSGSSGAVWTMDAQAAAQSLPGNFQYSEVRPVILTSEGGRNYGCYEFRGSGETGETVTIYIDADSGRERRIEVSRNASF